MRNVLVCRLDNEGDVLLTGPAIRAIAAGPSRVTLLCGPRGRAAAELLPGVDDVVDFHAPWIDPDPEPVRRDAVLGLVAALEALSIDQALVFTSFHQNALPTALVLRLAGIPEIAAISEDYPGSLLDVRARDPGDLHEVERALSLAEAAGYRLPPGDDARLAIRRPLGADARGSERETPLSARVGREPCVVVHPGASVPARTPSPEWWAELVEALAGTGRLPVVTGSPGERPLTRFVAGELGLDLGGATDLAALAEVLARADAVVVGNTGPAHLAAAVGTPVVSLFAPVVPAVRWRPWGVPHVLLGDQEAACRETRARECPLPGHPCLNAVAFEDVLAAVERLAPVRAALRFVEAAR